jgi:transposase
VRCVQIPTEGGRLFRFQNGHCSDLLARVGPDYHVEVDSFFYSVPHTLIREQVEVCITARTIEVFHRGKRVAAHLRRYGGRLHGTDPEHMPSAHRRYAEWTPERFQRWGQSIGPAPKG